MCCCSRGRALGSQHSQLRTPHAWVICCRPLFPKRLLFMVHTGYATAPMSAPRVIPTQPIYSSLRPPGANGALSPGLATLGAALFTTPAAGAQVADCTLTLSPGAHVSVAFLISLAAVEPDSQPPLVLACTR